MCVKTLAVLTCFFMLSACEWEIKDTLPPRAYVTYCYSDASRFELLRDRLEQSGIDFDSDEAKNCVSIYDAVNSERAEAIEDALPLVYATYCHGDASHFELLRDRLEQSGIDFDSDEVENCVSMYDAVNAEQVEAIKVELFGVFPPSGRSVSMGKERNKELVDLLNSHGIETETYHWYGNEYVSWSPEDSEQVEAIKAELIVASLFSENVSMGEERNKELVDLLNSHGIETEAHYRYGDEYISWSPEDSEKAEELLDGMWGKDCAKNSEKKADE